MVQLLWFNYTCSTTFASVTFVSTSFVRLSLLNYPFFFVLPLLLPVIVRVLSVLAGMGTHPTQARPVAGPGQPSPLARQRSTQESFAAAKADYPAILIDLDSEITLAEEFGIDLVATDIELARKHMNQAFATYSKYFSGDDHLAINVPAARRAVDKHLALAKRHLLLADPKTADTVSTDDDANYFAAGMMKGEYADQVPTPAPVPAQPQPMAPRTSIRLTPFGLVISSH